VHPKVATLLPVALLLAVPLACSSSGSGSNGGGGGNGSLSKSSFASKSNGYCVQASAERSEVSTAVPSGRQPTAQDADKVIAIDREVIRKIDALVPPDSEQDQVDQLLDQFHQRIAVEEQLRASIANGTPASDPATVKLGGQIATIDQKSAKIAKPLGLTSCIRQGA
jgi:hypothetical protein